jgi:TusA-related sulfurtransferase
MPEETIKADRVSDQIGIYCPEPIFRTRQELDEMKPGEVLEVVADDPATAEDLPRLAKRTGDTMLRWYKQGNELHFFIKKAG